MKKICLFSTKKTKGIEGEEAEIEQLRLHKAQFFTSDNKVCIDSQDVLHIIDKHKVKGKAEIEGHKSTIDNPTNGDIQKAVLSNKEELEEDMER